MTPAQAASHFGVTLNQMIDAWGITRRSLERMWYTHPARFEIIALGVASKSKPLS